MADDPRRFAPATERNRDPILAVLQRVLPTSGVVLEVASGTGEHAIHFARGLPRLEWQPSDLDDDSLASIEAWRDHEKLANLRPPLRLDVQWDEWPIADIDAIFSANMIHIAPWSACEGLVRGAGRTLPTGGLLVMYGPYHVDGRPTAESNARFDADLRRRNPAWGVRDLEAVVGLAERQGLHLRERIAMPANNFTLVFIRSR